MDRVEILLAEYKTLRQESLNAMNNRNRILSFGLATIGAILAGSIVAYTNNTHSPVSRFALIVMVPVISSFVLLMWFGEYKRMQRAGKFLSELEKRINKVARERLLTWETHLRKNQLHMKYPYYATVALLLMISLFSLVLGLIVAGFPANRIWLAAITGALIHLGLGLYVRSHILKLLQE